MRNLILLLMLPFLSAAQNADLWKLEFPSAGGLIPVHIQIEGKGKDLKAYALNAGERFQFDRAEIKNDSIHLHIDLYDNELVLFPKGNKVSGYLNKRFGDMSYRKAYFTGTKDKKERFNNPKKLNPETLAKKYEVSFKNLSSGNTSPAIGVFEVNNGEVNGTFLTTTGDYRYLQGNIVGDSLFLSAFGLNVTLYKAKIKGDSLVGGEVVSPYGKSSEFSGIKNDVYQLPDPSKLTYLKEGYDKFDFTFADTKGKKISLSDAQFKDKVTVIQILGTWCPNCLDETKFLMDYKKTNTDLQIIGLAFERSAAPDFAHPKIERFIQRFGVDYPVLLAGKIEEAAEKLPQLNKVMAFPTSIIVDKKGVVRKIHTGFSGPGTGTYYEEYVKEFSELISRLQAE